MAVSDVILLKNSCHHLPVISPSSLMVAGNHDLSSLVSAIRQHWPDAGLQLPSTRNPVRLETLARKTPLVLLSLVVPLLKQPILPRGEMDLVTKVARLRQAIVLLRSARPIAMQPWCERTETLVWAHPDTSAGELLAVLSGMRQPGRLPFALPRHAGNLRCLEDGQLVQREDVSPAFSKGFGLTYAETPEPGNGR
jgi:hypothetical protein